MEGPQYGDGEQQRSHHTASHIASVFAMPCDLQNMLICAGGGRYFASGFNKDISQACIYALWCKVYSLVRNMACCVVSCSVLLTGSLGLTDIACDARGGMKQ